MKRYALSNLYFTRAKNEPFNLRWLGRAAGIYRLLFRSAYLFLRAACLLAHGDIIIALLIVNNAADKFQRPAKSRQKEER